MIHILIDEAANQLGGEAHGRGGSQQIGENCSVVPSKMPVRARLIFPGITPVGAGANECDRGVRNRGLVAGGLHQDVAIVTFPEFV